MGGTYSAASPAKGDWSGIIVQPGAAATFDRCDDSAGIGIGESTLLGTVTGAPYAWHLHLGVLDEAEVALCPYDARLIQGPPR